MLTNKTQTVLLIYYIFLSEGHLIKKDFLSRVEISDLSFKRYISELRCFFANFTPENSIVYDRRNDIYLLVKGNKDK
jgi:hypothetical protein